MLKSPEKARNDEPNFIRQIGKLGEPRETAEIVDLARDFWRVAPEIQKIDAETGKTVAETNVRTALSLINLLGGDERIDMEKLLLASLTKNLAWGGVENSFDENSPEFSLAREQSDAQNFAFSASTRHIFDLASDLTKVRRDILLAKNHWEDDSEHTLQTALISWKVAKRFAPELDAAEVLKMALAHELAETITGDVSTFSLTSAQLLAKKRRDEAAAREFAEKFRDAPKLVAEFLKYEDKMTPGAKFVYWIDKILPAFSKYQPDERAHSLAPPTEVYEFGGMSHPGRNINRETLRAWYDNTRAKLLGAGAPPNEICERLLAQNFAWLNWLFSACEEGTL